jgi:hypothetical protein
MNKLKHLAFLAALIPLGCSGPEKAVFALEQIHRAPGPGESCLNRQGRELLRYNTEVVLEPGEDGDEVDDPVAFCLEWIEELGDASEWPLREKGAAVYILCYIGSRSPSALVRIEAFETLRSICGEVARGFRFQKPNLVGEEWLKRREEWLAMAAAESEKTLPGIEEENRLADLIGYFGALRCDSARQAWESLALLTVRGLSLGTGSALGAEIDGAIRALMGQAVFMTAGEGLFDTSEFVVREAVDCFFLFHHEDTMAPLTELVEHCYDGPTRIHIMDKLRAADLATGDLGVRLMIQVRESLDFSDPGVVFHAVQLMQELTGIPDDDPGFWRSWWSDYIREHADELRDPRFDERLKNLPDRRG